MKKVILTTVIGLILLATTVNAEDMLQYGQEIEIQTDLGNYKITVDKIIESNQFDYLDDKDSRKVVCVDCVIENIDYKNYDNVLNSSEIGSNEVVLLDEDGISTEFYNIQMSSNDGYEFWTNITPGEMKRIALPFFVMQDTNEVTVKIDSQYEISQNLSEEINKTEEKVENDDGTDLKKQIQTLESENDELKSKNETLKKENEELKEAQKEKEKVQTEIESEQEKRDDDEIEKSSEKQYSDANTIKDVQQKLNEIGYDCGTPDGVIGEKTRGSIIAFKQNYGSDSNDASITQEFLDKLDLLVNSEKSENKKNIEEVMKDLENVSTEHSLDVVKVSSEDGVYAYAIFYNSIKYGAICNSDNEGKITLAIIPMKDNTDGDIGYDYTMLLSYVLEAIDANNQDTYLQVINTINYGQSEYNGTRCFTDGDKLENLTFYMEW